MNSSDTIGALQQMLLQKAGGEDLTDLRNKRLEEYQAALRSPASGGFSPAQAMGFGWAANTGRTNSMAALGQGIAQGGAQLAQDMADRVKGDVSATKAGYEDVKDLDKQNTQMLLYKQAMGGSKGIEGVLPNGNKYIKSGTRYYELVPNPNNPEGYDMKEIVSAEKTIMGADPLLALAEKKTGEIFKALDAGGAFEGWKEDQLKSWHEQTLAEITAKLGTLGRSQAGVTPSPSPVVNASPRVQKTPPSAQPQTFEAGTPEANNLIQDELSKAIKMRDSSPVGSQDRMNANATIANLKKELPSAVIKSGRDLAQGKEYGGAEGKSLQAERAGWGNLYQASNSLVNQLDTLKQLYKSNPDIVSGEAAPVFQSLKSGMESLGVKLGDSPRMEDVIRSVTTGMALHAKTSGGTNLLPGAMSNYEDQLLQKMQPSLSLTQEGRLQLIDFMSEAAKSNQRMATYATQYEQEHGRLDQGWNTVKERKAKEEMARLAILNRRIMAQYGAKK